MPSLRGDRADRRPLGVVLALVFEDQAHGPLSDFLGVPRLSVHGSILSRAGASEKAGAVQGIRLSKSPGGSRSRRSWCRLRAPSTYGVGGGRRGYLRNNETHFQVAMPVRRASLCSEMSYAAACRTSRRCVQRFVAAARCGPAAHGEDMLHIGGTRTHGPWGPIGGSAL